MGTFYQTIVVLAPDSASQREVEALVDTGSTYLWLPGSLLLELGYKPVTRRQLTVATGETIERDLAPVLLEMGGETWPIPCVFSDESSTPLLGAIALEAFGLGVDPVNRRLVPVPSLALSLAG